MAELETLLAAFGLAGRAWNTPLAELSGGERPAPVSPPCWFPDRTSSCSTNRPIISMPPGSDSWPRCFANSTAAS